MDKLKIEYVDINSIHPYKKNAKEHPREQIEQIKKSIELFGMDDPIGVWNNEIVEGHGRLIACKELGMTEVPIIRIDHLTDEERKSYTLIHNKLTMNSGFDLQMLNSELEEIENIDMTDFGFDLDLDEEEEKEEAEVEFTEVLGEEHNYIVLYFDNEVDWLQAESIFDIKPVKNLSTRKDGKITKGMESKGIGRVIKGRDAINKIMGWNDENIS